MPRKRPEEGLVLSDSERRTIAALEADLLADPAFARAVARTTRRLPTGPAPVVLGVRADGPLPEAVRWAAAEAALHRSPLRIVSALRPRMLVDPFGMAPVCDVLADERAAGRAAVDAAVALARSVAPGTEVTAHLVPGPAMPALLRESATARLVVVGSRAARPHPGRLPALLDRSLPGRLAAVARCPVTVVHPAPEAAGPFPGCGVVVGIDGTTGSDDALAFALRSAHQRGTCLTAVHAWSADRPADLEAVAAPPSTTEAGAWMRAERAVGRWRFRFPDVPVVVEVVRRDPVAALLAGSAGAALVVVGTRGRGHTRGAVFGSVSRAVLGGVPGPVVVVPPGAAG